MSLNPPKQTLQHRLRPLYFASFFQGFVLYYAVEKLFMKSIGISDGGIALIIVVFTLVMMLGNLPLGILADRWSRKGVLIVGAVLLALGTLVEALSTNFWGYLIGACLWGLYYAALTGTYESVVYDTLLEETGSGDKFEFYYGKVQLFDGAALVLSSLASGLVVHVYNLQATYFVTIPLALISIVGLWRFKEPQLHKSTIKTLLGAHIKDTLRAVLRRREVMWLTLSLIAITVTARLILEFDQLWLIALALPLVLYGPVNALLLTAYGMSGVAADRLKRRRSLVVGLVLIMTLASISLLFHVVSLIIIAEFLIVLGVTGLEVLTNRWLHDALPSKIRTGASSAATTLGYAVFLPVGLLFGEISRRTNVFGAGWVIIAACVTVAICVIAASKRMKTV